MYYWNTWYTAWGWFLWVSVLFLFFSSLGNWGYTYRAHSRIDDEIFRDAIKLLNERYARGDIDHESYLRVKSNILSERGDALRAREEKRRENREDKKQSELQPNY